MPSTEIPELETYHRIDRNELAARFLVAKSVRVDCDPWELDDASLRSVHEEGMEEFKAVWEEEPSPRDVAPTSPSLLDVKVEIARRLASPCEQCERRCGVNREEGERGYCGVGWKPTISSEFLHLGEERVLVPSHTVFFCGCTFRCVYCQNWDIAFDPDGGVEVPPEKLANVIKYRRRTEGSRNVNWVGGDPTPALHYVLRVLQVLDVNVPQVWNSNMYMSLEAVEILEGVIDLYLADFRYGNDRCASRYSDVEGYWEVVTRNHELAYEQCDLIVRQLVLPNHVECCTFPILEWIANNLGTDVPLNVMPQYRPEYRAREFEEISRRPTEDEIRAAWRKAEELGFRWYRL